MTENPIYKAGVQYRCGDETFTPARDFYIGDPITESAVVEINGLPVKVGEIVPSWIVNWLEHHIEPEPGTGLVG